MLPFVNSASNAEVLLGMQKIKTDFLPHSILLENTNQLGIDAANAIVQHFHPTNPVHLSNDDARTYLAASSFIHCKDGWQYLSNSVDTIFKGDSKTSVHLSYYAELRAAMSFLASEGIAVLNNMHFSITNPTNIVKDPKSSYSAAGFPKGWGTHRFIWDCLNTFVNSPTKNLNHLLESFWHNGLSFDKWITHIPHANSIAVISEIIKYWIRDWSFDISHFNDDRQGRNNASYCPSKFNDFVTEDCKPILENYSNCLRLLEPDSSNKFSLLDKYLFKILFLRIHAEIIANGIPITPEILLDNTFANARKPMDASLKTIILSPVDHTLILSSRDTVVDPGTGDIKLFTIFSRALLLSRIATASVSCLLRRSPITKNELGFLLEFCGVNHGFWAQGDPVPDLEELWVDLSDALTDIDAWVATQASPLDLKTFNIAQSVNLTIYKQINRVNYWGIAI